MLHKPYILDVLSTFKKKSCSVKRDLKINQYHTAQTGRTKEGKLEKAIVKIFMCHTILPEV